MDSDRQRRVCQLGLHEARCGALPPVCICCGSATPSFYRMPLQYRLKRVVLALPLCPSDKVHIALFSLVPLGFAVGFAFCGVAAVLGIILTLHPFSPGTEVIEVVYYLPFTFAVLMGCALLVARFIPAISGSLIVGMSRESVTLRNVAPEFIEALRVYRAKGQT